MADISMIMVSNFSMWDGRQGASCASVIWRMIKLWGHAENIFYKTFLVRIKSGIFLLPVMRAHH